MSNQPTRYLLKGKVPEEHVDRMLAVKLVKAFEGMRTGASIKKLSAKTGIEEFEVQRIMGLEWFAKYCTIRVESFTAGLLPMAANTVAELCHSQNESTRLRAAEALSRIHERASKAAQAVRATGSNDLLDFLEEVKNIDVNVIDESTRKEPADSPTPSQEEDGRGHRADGRNGGRNSGPLRDGAEHRPVSVDPDRGSDATG